MAMMLNHDLRNNAAGARLLRQAREDVASALLEVGFVTCFTAAVRAASSQPAESGLAYDVYLGALVGAFLCGLSTIWAAGWVAGDAARRRATGWIILCASLVPMAVAVCLGNYSDSASFGLYLN